MTNVENGKIRSHKFIPELNVPGRCGAGACGQSWDHEIHNPANLPAWGGKPKTYLRLTSSAQVVNEQVKAMNDANEQVIIDHVTPKCPVGDCPQTHPHLHPRPEADSVAPPAASKPAWADNVDVATPPHAFVMKPTATLSNQYVENADFCDNCDCLYTTYEFHPDELPIKCPISTSCSDYVFDRPSHYINHAMAGHDLTQDQAIDYLQNPWYVGESRADWNARIPDQAWWRKYQAGKDAVVTVRTEIDPTAVQEALRQFSEGFPRMAAHLAAQAAPEATETPTEAREEPDFRDWWVAWVDNAAPTIQRKAAEYGSNSLAEMGRMFARAQGRGHIEDHEALEIGCMIYTKGKIERVLDAMLKGRLPSADTWADTMVYSAMASYIREFRRWP